MIHSLQNEIGSSKKKKLILISSYKKDLQYYDAVTCVFSLTIHIFKEVTLYNYHFN